MHYYGEFPRFDPHLTTFVSNELLDENHRRECRQVGMLLFPPVYSSLLSAWKFSLQSNLKQWSLRNPW